MAAAEVKKLIVEAVLMHLEALREEGMRIPEPGDGSKYIEV